MPKIYPKYIQSISKGGDDMPDYQKLYALMFNAATDALALWGTWTSGRPGTFCGRPSARRRNCI